MGSVALLDHLERVKQTGPGRWIARCPAHEDRSPSLSVRELEDGRLLRLCHKNDAHSAPVRNPQRAPTNVRTRVDIGQS
jgi:hypothetical protein